MRTRTIRIDEEVFEELQWVAKREHMQFKTPNYVLRWVLKMQPPPTERRTTDAPSVT